MNNVYHFSIKNGSYQVKYYQVWEGFFFDIAEMEDLCRYKSEKHTSSDLQLRVNEYSPSVKLALSL